MSLIPRTILLSFLFSTVIANRIYDADADQLDFLLPLDYRPIRTIRESHPHRNPHVSEREGTRIYKRQDACPTDYTWISATQSTDTSTPHFSDFKSLTLSIAICTSNSRPWYHYKCPYRRLCPSRDHTNVHKRSHSALDHRNRKFNSGSPTRRPGRSDEYCERSTQ